MAMIVGLDWKKVCCFVLFIAGMFLWLPGDVNSAIIPNFAGGGDHTVAVLPDGALADRNRPVTVLGLTITANGAPPAPTMILITQGLNVSVFWSPVAGATGYTLCYAPYPWMPWMTMNDIVYVNVGNMTSFSIDLWQGAAYYVALHAYNAQGSSDFSNISYFVMGP